jgi:hypothetical protein
MIRILLISPIKSRKRVLIVIPAEAGIQLVSDNYENTGHRFSPVRRLFTR